uniref:Uncharacterized protein TCIL3000_10_480 n=1 Tax=Trypanosoma congolense (strain IL3000) TaxID=1068625 RepID=G0UV74_TRYCI|nr:unnamed protein product [Trypanosoma congolense IL3000]
MEFPQVTCDDVNALVRMCSISHEKAITSLKQCSSSLFVLLYQRLFNCTINGIDSSPYTVEQKKWNVTCVLSELRDKRGINVEGIDAEQIVRLNEEHISRLIALFLAIANHMSLHGGVGFSQQTSGIGLAAPVTFPETALRPKIAEVPQESAEDGTWYYPAGRVMLPTHQMRPVYPTRGYMSSVAATHTPPDAAVHHGYYDPAHFKGTDGAAYLEGGFIYPRRSVGGDHPEMVDAGVSVSREEEDSGEEDKTTSVADRNDGESTGSYGNFEGREIPISELVEVWSAQVIPPSESAGMHPAGLTNVHERLTAMDEYLRKRAQQRKSRQLPQRAPKQGTRQGVAGRGTHDLWKSNKRAASNAFPSCNFHSETIMNEKCFQKQPKRMIDYERRNEKIEMLRSMRFIDELEREISRKMVQRHRDITMMLRNEVKVALVRDRQEVMERKRFIREEDQKYRNAYTAILTAAGNSLRTAKGLMLERMQLLAQQQELSLRESRRMCRHMKRESKARVRHDLLRYVSTVTEWQSQLAS